MFLLLFRPLFDGFLNKIQFSGFIWRTRVTTRHLLRRLNRSGSILLAWCRPRRRGLLSGRARACQARSDAYASDLRVCCVRVYCVSVLSQAIFKPCSLQRALPPLPHFLKRLCGNVNPALSDGCLFCLLRALALLNRTAFSLECLPR